MLWNIPYSVRRLQEESIFEDISMEEVKEPFFGKTILNTIQFVLCIFFTSKQKHFANILIRGMTGEKRTETRVGC